MKLGNTMKNYHKEEYMNIFINQTDGKERDEEMIEKQMRDEDRLRKAFEK